jgi:transposase
LDSDRYAYDVTEDAGAIHIYAKSIPHGCRCPDCGEESRQLHATYARTLQDTPIRCKRTLIHLNVYKYKCENPQCPRKVFMEELPFARPSQVRTDALTCMIIGIAMFMSSEGASKVLALIGVNASNDTIQRILNGIEFVDDPDVEAIGVDDVAMRKGQKYATAVYDMRDHRLIALLDGRDGKPFKEWLETHGKVRLVARDRASAYAAAINEVLPDCVQVADRFHLLQNLIDRLKDVFKDKMPPEIFIRGGEILARAPGKVPAETKPNEALLASLDYDNSEPLGPDGAAAAYDGRLYRPTGKRSREQKENRKKNSS